MEDNTKNEEFTIRSMGTAESLISNIEGNNNLDNREKNEKAYDIVQAVFNAVQKGYVLSGSGDDFHNFSVTLIRLSEDYETALEIVDIGLGLHPSNTDLLSDAIRYGMNCGKHDICEERFVQLSQLPKSLWTWRAFSFSIDYILSTLGNIKDATEKDIKEKADEALLLSSEYQKYYPQLEDSWYSQYEIYKAINEREMAMQMLQKIVEHKIEQAPVLCPKSWLKYADENIEIGNADEARIYIAKLRQYPEAADSVNFSYVYYLDGLCQMKELMFNDDYPEEKVKKVYRSFRLGLNHKSLYSSNKMRIIDKIQMLEELSEIPYPWSY